MWKTHFNHCLAQPLINLVGVWLLLGMGLVTSVAFAQTTYSGITFPDGDASFADSVVAYNQGVFPASTSLCNSPNEALGAPDFTYGVTCGGYVSLGQGGSLTLKFENPALIASNSTEPDIHIFEVGSAVETFRLEISQDNINWITIGEISGQPSSVDIDAHPSVSGGQSFAYVRLTDLSNSNNGADIDAIGVNPSYPPPTSDAGADQAVPSANVVTLDGSGSTPGVAGLTLTYQWTQTSGPTVTLSDASIATPNFTAPTIAINGSDQTLGFGLVVTDSQGRVSTSDTMTVTVNAPNDTPPTAQAGINQSVTSGAVVTLNGSGSFDPDVGDTITYAWQQTAGPTVSLSSATAVKPSFTAPVLNVGANSVALSFSLVVTDSFGLSSAADVTTVTVNAPNDTPPTADAGPDQSVVTGASVVLNGANSFDPDDGDSITYLWQQRSGPAVELSSAAAVLPTFVAPTVAVGAASIELIFALVVTDSFGLASQEDTVVVSVHAPDDAPPVADAGIKQSVASGARVILDGTGAYDPDVGDVITYQWSQRSGQTVTLSDPSAVQPEFVAPTLLVTDDPIQLLFELVVTDSFGLQSAPAAVAVTVNPPNDTPPTADAGPNRVVAEGQAAALDGSGSFDPDPGDAIKAYQWRQLAGPRVTLNVSDPVKPKFRAPTLEAEDSSGGLVFELTVVDLKDRVSRPSRTVVSVAPANDLDARPINVMSSQALVWMVLSFLIATAVIRRRRFS